VISTTLSLKRPFGFAFPLAGFGACKVLPSAVPAVAAIPTTPSFRKLRRVRAFPALGFCSNDSFIIIIIVSRVYRCSCAGGIRHRRTLRAESAG
jgi:hypothetical protein